MQQIQIDIPEPTLPNTLLDRPPRRVVRGIRLQLRREPDICSPETACGEEFQDGGADFALVGVPFCGVDGAVAGFEGVVDGGGGFAAGGHVDTEVDAGHLDAIVELDRAGEGIW